MSIKNVIKAIPLSTINSNTVGNNYQAVNGTGTPNSCFSLVINNASNSAITVSFDGSTDHEYMQANTRVDFAYQNQNGPNNYVSLWPRGTIVYVKGAAGVGTIAVGGYYHPNVQPI